VSHQVMKTGVADLQDGSLNPLCFAGAPRVLYGSHP